MRNRERRGVGAFESDIPAFRVEQTEDEEQIHVSTRRSHPEFGANGPGDFAIACFGVLDEGCTSGGASKRDDLCFRRVRRGERAAMTVEIQIGPSRAAQRPLIFIAALKGMAWVSYHECDWWFLVPAI